MNLVASSTIDQIWNRHFADSAQLIGLGPKTAVEWADIGAGAGFPGIVVAMLTTHEVTLIESIGKKCRFLEAVIDDLGLANARIYQGRAEAFAEKTYDIVSARACAPLAKLFDIGSYIAKNEASWILPKGKTAYLEVNQARLAFDFDAELIPSRTDARGRIVVARNVRRKAHRW